MIERIVEPYYLVSYKGEWYLSGFCHTRKSIRTFGVSRISKAAVLDEPFIMPAGMTSKRMYGDRFGIIWKEDFHKTRIRFEAEVAPYIRERKWHPTQQIVERRDGGLVLEFTTNHSTRGQGLGVVMGAPGHGIGPGLTGKDGDGEPSRGCC